MMVALVRSMLVTALPTLGCEQLAQVTGRGGPLDKVIGAFLPGLWDGLTWGWRFGASLRPAFGIKGRVPVIDTLAGVKSVPRPPPVEKL
jgi:hypothetical protein